MANSAGRVQPLLLVKNRRNKLVKENSRFEENKTREFAVRSLDQLCVLLERVSIALFRDMCDDQDILNCYFVPGTLYRALVPRERLALCLDVALLRKMNRDSTHSWIAKFFY